MASLDCNHRSAAPNVADDKIHIVQGYSEPFCDRSGNERVADAMKTVSFQTLSLRNRLVDRIRSPGLGDRVMKCCIEVSEILRSGKSVSADIDKFKRGGIMTGALQC